jgi:hypothetical protein
MRRISQRKQFRSDLKRQKRRGRDIDELIAAVELLAEQGAIPPAIILTNCRASGAGPGSVTLSRIGF